MNYKELKQLIQKHNQAYYDNSASVITDAEYDQLYDKLENMEKAQGWRDHDSPTKHVGGAAGKVTHPYGREGWRIKGIDRCIIILVDRGIISATVICFIAARVFF